MNQILRTEILEAIGQLSTDTCFGQFIRERFDRSGDIEPTDEDVMIAVREIQEQIKCSPNVMRNILGNVYEFFDRIFFGGQHENTLLTA